MVQVDIALGSYEAAQKRLEECNKPGSSRPVGSPLYVAGNDLYGGIVVGATGETAVAHTLSPEAIAATKAKAKRWTCGKRPNPF